MTSKLKTEVYHFHMFIQKKMVVSLATVQSQHADIA